MSSVPGEVLRDILLPLDRWTLDDVQFTNRRFLQLILGHMSDVCLRQVHHASLVSPDWDTDEEWTAFIQVDGLRKLEFAHKYSAHMFTAFVQALRSSRVASLTLTAPKEVQYEELELRDGSFTKDLFQRLVEASGVSKRTLPLRIVVSPLPFEEEDLHEFAQYLSYEGDEPYHRVYDFPGEQHGAVAAMHLQIMLDEDDSLIMLRAPRPSPSEADEWIFP